MRQSMPLGLYEMLREPGDERASGSGRFLLVLKQAPVQSLDTEMEGITHVVRMSVTDHAWKRCVPCEMDGKVNKADYEF